MNAKLKPNNGSIVVYYEHKGKMRFPTQITISREQTKGRKFKEWDYKNSCIRNTVENYASSNEILFQKLKKAQDIINDHLKIEIKIGAKELEAELKGERQEKQLSHSALLLEWFDQFFERKYKILVENPLKSETSIKNYTTFKNTILDYEFDLQEKIKVLEIINYDWCVNFSKWMQKKRPKTETKNGKTHR